jgi:hypothetical protein
MMSTGNRTREASIRYLDPTIKETDIGLFSIDAVSAEDERVICYLSVLKRTRFQTAIRQACETLRNPDVSVLRVEICIDAEVVAIVS